MNIDREVDYLQRHRSLHLENLLPKPYCGELIARYNDTLSGSQPSGTLADVEKQLLAECTARVFTDDLDTLLTEYFQGPFKPWWSTFDVVGSAGASHNPNTLWHLDGGVRGTHKLFIYLNPVAEHGGNTVMVDRERTKQLLQANALPVEQDKRKEDLSAVFEELGVSPEVLAYDLKAGDGLIFDPLTLAHRCQPTMAGKWRYTLCFTIAPI